MRPSTSLLESALAYAERGIQVIPLHSTDAGGACSCGKLDCGSAGKHPRTPHGFHDATCDKAAIRQWWTLNPDANIGVATGASGLVVIDVDTKDGRPGLYNWTTLAAQTKVEHGVDLRHTCAIETPSGGRHLYYRAGDHRIACSAGKLADGIDVRGQGGYVVAPPSVIGGVAYRYMDGHGPERLADLPGVLAQRLSTCASNTNDSAFCGEAAIPKGERNDRLFRDACAMRKRGHTEQEILAALRETNKRCDPPLADEELLQVVTSAMKYEPGPAKEAKEAQEGTGSTACPWPAPLGEAAFHGPLGDLVCALEPCNEADPAALLINSLVGFGSLVGADPHVRVGADLHPGRLFAALVGESSKARKGMSWGPIRDTLTEIDATWRERVMDGIASGEGLIWAVHDPIKKLVPRKGKGEKGLVEELVDAGVSDKRLLISEGEFARVLKVMGRPDNTVSPVMRNAWDTGELRSLTKTSPAKASGAHICVIGHITRTELLSLLTSTEAGNGFGNRFLWVCVKRSKRLPFGGTPRTEDLTPIVADLATARQFAFTVEEIAWGEDARLLWESVYGELSEGQPGLVGALTARAEAQVLRLALIYALADCSEVICRVHLEAALEVWRYCEESATYVFGSRSGNQVADTIVAELRKRDAPVSRTEISELFKHHKSAAQIDEALALLKSLGRVSCEIQQTDGRPREVWHAL